ncbi:Gfo/Idh/MocA family protein [Streptomyces cyanogenus]|uniref:1,5-anhydro-D-fructose reductase n=1 Tax=Streptomyces cyanogenus TaxID=80860 RepID=A0ABX7TXS8_STRCY|nr:Gfo/Idh/MocA family oxidoreductase [Streptomyces cyanogenus]QTE01585.1 1,5-anhydro-D-fructose reductase [Streptomyces cyanogenus]
MKTVRIGVLGCADIARRRMLPAMAAEPGITIAAVASRDSARAGELAGRFGARPVTGYAELLERDDIDAVYVPLPAALHARWTEAALRAGKHVLAEKPLTTSLAESRRLIALAQESGLALMENVMFIHHSQHDAVRKLVWDGVIGELRAFHAAFAIPRLPDDDIRYVPELGGGALWDTGVYPVRAALHFLGDNLQVLGAMLTQEPGRRVDTAGSALLRTPEGVGVQLTFGLDHGYRSAYEIWGSQGRITVERAFTPPADHRPLIRVERRGVEEISLSPDDQVAATLRAFTAAVRDGAARDSVCVRQAELLHELRERALPSRP